MILQIGVKALDDGIHAADKEILELRGAMQIFVKTVQTFKAVLCYQTPAH